MDRATTGAVGSVDASFDVSAVGTEELDCFRDLLTHLGSVGVDFAGAEGEVQHAPALGIGRGEVNGRSS